MSAALSGKFQDHYTILGVEPRSNSDVIQAAYAKLAERYHPSNKDTGSQEKFDSVNLAFETLSDPLLRAEFDKIKGIDIETGGPTFSGLAFFNMLGLQNRLRSAVLCVLYDRRKKNPFKPSLSMRHLDNMLDVTNDELGFALWYLKQKGLAQSDDKSNLQITVEGMDFLEDQRPAPDIVIPLIKAAALAAPIETSPGLTALSNETSNASTSNSGGNAIAPATAFPVADREKPDSAVNALNRALARR